MNIGIKTTAYPKLHAMGPQSKQRKFLHGQLRHNRRYCEASNLRQTLNIRVKENKERQNNRKEKHFYLNGTML